MEVILHCGAHRCASTSFQTYLRSNAQLLENQGLVYWGPEETRTNGLNRLDDVTPVDHAGLHRELDKCQRDGAEQVLISQENFVGSMKRNIGSAMLYPSAGERGQWLAGLFEGRVTRIALNIRALDRYWASVAAYMFKRGNVHIPPERWTRIAESRRSWRAVITDLGRSFSNIPLLILPFEEFAGQQQAQLEALTGRPAPGFHDGLALNGAPEPAPFGLNAKQATKLWIDYTDDLDWLASGADGLAQLICHTNTNDRRVLPAENRLAQRNST